MFKCYNTIRAIEYALPATTMTFQQLRLSTRVLEYAIRVFDKELQNLKHFSTHDKF